MGQPMAGMEPLQSFGTQASSSLPSLGVAPVLMIQDGNPTVISTIQTEVGGGGGGHTPSPRDTFQSLTSLFLLTSHGPEIRHMAKPHYKESWEV